MERYARGSAVAVIRLRNPPVNALRYRRQSAGNAGAGDLLVSGWRSLRCPSFSPYSLSLCPRDAPPSPGAGAGPESLSRDIYTAQYSQRPGRLLQRQLGSRFANNVLNFAVTSALSYNF